MSFLRDISAEYMELSPLYPICLCNPMVFPPDWLQGFQAGCEIQKSFLKSMMMFELKQLGYCMQVQVLEYSPVYM